MNSLMKFTINAFIYFLILNFGLCFNVVQSTVHLKFNNYGNRKLSCASFQFQCKNEQQIEGNFFQCDNGACIDKLHKCDGIEQCCDGSDEWAQNCETNSLENRKKRATSGNCEPIPSSHNQTIIYECDNGTSQTCIINGLISEKTVAKVVCNKSHSAEKEIGFESICFRNKWYPDVRKCDDTEKTPRGCETNKDCHSTLACEGYKCVDPCPDNCGAAAICVTSNHLPKCWCPSGFSGDPFIQCTPVTLLPEKLPSENPCYPSPCGPFSQCRVIDQQAACSCLPEYLGTPPNCRPECVVSSECTRDRACIKEKCVDPCLNACGLHAVCNVINHNPICFCPHQYTGDALSQCLPIGVVSSIDESTIKRSGSNQMKAQTTNNRPVIGYRQPRPPEKGSVEYPILHDEDTPNDESSTSSSTPSFSTTVSNQRLIPSISPKQPTTNNKQSSSNQTNAQSTNNRPHIGYQLPRPPEKGSVEYPIRQE